MNNDYHKGGPPQGGYYDPNQQQQWGPPGGHPPQGGYYPPPPQQAYGAPPGGYGYPAQGPPQQVYVQPQQKDGGGVGCCGAWYVSHSSFLPSQSIPLAGPVSNLVTPNRRKN
ncbi:hypothetical protein BT69DRAFT_1335333 [Atractiella rhizophila]|nr:hypothetical protein BT69DRAFT_1335333 [Atractiella rhizophila]